MMDGWMMMYELIYMLCKGIISFIALYLWAFSNLLSILDPIYIAIHIYKQACAYDFMNENEMRMNAMCQNLN